LFEVAYILNKVLVKEFYRLNAGFFLVVMTLTFGFMSSVEHRALAEFFISAHLLMCIPIALWVLYGLKIINFNTQQIRRHENSFIFELGLLKSNSRFGVLLSITAAQFMPALLYGLFLVAIAQRHGKQAATVDVVASLLFIGIGITTVLFFQLHYPAREIKISFLKKFLDTRYSKPLVQFYTEWLTRREPVILLGTKLFGCILSFAVSQLYLAEAYDLRLMAMTATIVFAGNFMLLQQLHRFENVHFFMVRSLPITLLKRFLIIALVILILAIPEFATITRYFPENLSWYDYVALIIYSLSITLLFYALLFVRSIEEKNFTTLIFVFIIGWVLLILFSIPVGYLGTINIGAAWWIFRKHYYSFEYAATTGK
jgi:hypothetical protein